MPDTTKKNGYTVMSAAQARAARALLGLELDAVADGAEISVSSLRAIEAGRASPLRTTMVRLRRALEERGIVLLSEGELAPRMDESISGPGVRMRGGF